MSIAKGTRFGPYEVLGQIGAGGMGVVYSANDTQLKREVALKVLPEQFARDPERLARFRREAQLLASLNHPNIAAIYGLEESGPRPCLVMEYVPGETLADQIRRGPVEMEEALRTISVPVLITAMQGHYFLRDNEIQYEAAASKDKDFIVIEGASHGITPCPECETTPGQYSNSANNFFDYVQKWIDARF